VHGGVFMLKKTYTKIFPLQNIWNIINWKNVSERFEAARK
jgi:superoxide dismutase